MLCSTVHVNASSPYDVLIAGGLLGKIGSLIKSALIRFRDKSALFATKTSERFFSTKYRRLLIQTELKRFGLMCPAANTRSV